MTIVFIGGSRKISHLDDNVRHRIDNIIEKNLSVLVGDANGADKAVQKYLYEKGYQSVEVFCAGDLCRNNVGQWPVQAISTNGLKRGFGFYAAKDRVMGNKAALGFMLWDGNSVGTLMNMLRLLHQQKKVVVYLAWTKSFLELACDKDLEALISHYSPDLRPRLQKEFTAEQKDDQISRQTSFI